MSCPGRYGWKTVIIPGVFKKSLDVVQRDMVGWEILVIGGQWHWMILEIFSNLGDYMKNVS